MSTNMPTLLASRSMQLKQVMRLIANTNKTITNAEQTVIDDVKSFTYLGAIITTSGETNEDMRRRLGLARITYNKLPPVLNNSQI